MSKITAATELDRVKAEELPRHLAIFASAVTETVNGKLDFQTNFNCQVLSVAFSAASTDTIVAHNLGRVPQGYISLGTTVTMNVYDGAIGWTTSAISLRSTAIGTARLILI